MRNRTTLTTVLRRVGEFKVTVQFETEGNGENEFVSHMDRSEVKL